VLDLTPFTGSTRRKAPQAQPTSFVPRYEEADSDADLDNETSEEESEEDAGLTRRR
jgi:hypothetical protein